MMPARVTAGRRRRADDLRLLGALVDSGLLTDDLASSFGDMMARLDSTPSLALSEKQRAWAREVADRLEIEIDEVEPAKKNVAVDMAKGEAWGIGQSDVLRQLPKSPPRKRVAS